MRIAQIFRLGRDRLTKMSEKEPLSLFSLFLIVLFDIFLFSVIATGLSDVTKNVTAPSEYAGYSCLNLLDTDKIAKDDDRKLAVVRAIENSYSYGYGRSSSMIDEYGSYDSSGYGKGCEEIRAAVANIYRTEGAQSAFSRKMDELDNIDKLISSNQIEQQNARSIYDTKLLEKGVNQTETIDPGTASDLATKVANLRTSSGTLATQKIAIVNVAYGLPEIQDVVKLMESSASRIRSTYDSLVFWYPVKTFWMQLVFLVPLFLAILIWVRRSIVKNNEVQSLVGSHVIAVIAVFALIKLIEFVYDILPKKLIENIIRFLEDWNVIQIWYYVLVIFGIALCLFAIYIVQKKILSPRKQEMKRVAHGLCLRCGVRRAEGEEYCVSCGTKVFTKCISCGKQTFAGGEHCVKCGGRMENEE